jgi:hypothetical protein
MLSYSIYNNISDIFYIILIVLHHFVTYLIYIHTSYIHRNNLYIYTYIHVYICKCIYVYIYIYICLSFISIITDFLINFWLFDWTARLIFISNRSSFLYSQWYFLYLIDVYVKYAYIMNYNLAKTVFSKIYFYNLLDHLLTLLYFYLIIYSY